VPLKRIKDAWEKLYNAENMNPYLSQKKLSRIIREVGVNRAGQNIIFNELADLSKQFVYDLSSMFSRSMSINQAEKGYNKDKLHVPGCITHFLQAMEECTFSQKKLVGDSSLSWKMLLTGLRRS
jgi:hypothetical protein